LNEHSIHTGWAFYAGLLDALTQVMGTAKGYLFNHGPRVAHLARHIARRMGLGQEEMAELLFAGVLCDLGMIGMVEEAWENPKHKLHDEARRRLIRHPARSAAIVLAIPHLENLAPLVRHHHEWWDGSGYPGGLRGDDIPLGAQILRLADTVCALGEWRPHRPILSGQQIRDVVRRYTRSEFGPEVAGVYLDMADKGELPEGQPHFFHRAVMDAAAAVLPHEVSPLSSDKLLELLASLIDAKDPYTTGHSRRVAALSVAVANQLALGDHVRITLWAAGYLHDLGKVSVPLRILTKAGPLDALERRAVQAHPSDGARILEGIPSLRHLAPGARYHHERWDGRGYPEGIRGERIPLVAQILAVADSYDAMTSKRSYRDSRTHQHAMDEIARSSGTQFGPSVASAFLALPDHFFSSVRQPRPERAELFRRPAQYGSQRIGPQPAV
jgi:HD-GYP domain-containing protein (c-di-GMP phosphodiesterase class II)